MFKTSEIRSTLRQVCIENNFFNDGSNEQYEKMFKLAEKLVDLYNNGSNADSKYAIEILTQVIWVCTDGVNSQNINSKITQWFERFAN